ncbi:MAG: DivIVA domain-containing protein [Oligoflexia bacterium]|nr:DivIVA domain-containing protein [Oligoflexia bacterium]
MRITPLDIIQKQFTAAARRGYDGEEVREFLEEVRESLEELLKENQRLRETVQRREQEIEELRGAEADISETLLLARRLTDELQRSSRRQADVLVGEARLEAERILLAASDERRTLQQEIIGLQTSRVRLIADLRSVIEAHGLLLDEMLTASPAAR